MIARRQFLLTGAAATLMGAAPPPLTLPEGDRIAFRVMREGEAIGTHVLSFDRLDDGFDVHIAVDIAVAFGPITVFRYTLRALEQWRGGQPIKLHCDTNDDGKTFKVSMGRESAGLRVTSNRMPSYLAPPDALPATHWNMAELSAPWINPQDGKLLHPAVGPTITEEVPLADGRRRRASRYPLSGDAHLDLWYDLEKRWSALEFAAKDGSHVTYQLT
jgi:hypothetical protein